MKKFSNKERLTGTIFEDIGLLEDLMGEFYDLKLNFLGQYFMIFRYYGEDLFPSMRSNFFKKNNKARKILDRTDK